MPRVKGSKQVRMVVVPHRPWMRGLLGAAVVLLLVAAGLGAHHLGYVRGVAENGDARAERDLLLEENRAFEDQIAQIRQQLVNAEQESHVDKRSLEQVQGTILTLRERITQLEEDILFYKNIMSPENDERGLVIGQFDLVALDETRQYRYRLELRQLGDNENLVNGHVNVNIQGQEGGAERTVPLYSLADGIDQQDIRLRFHYYQNIEGELILPEGFEPDTVEIVAVSENPANRKTVQKSFGWVVQDNE